jgi:hypothetical protein
MSTDKTISRRAEHTRKAYGTQLYNFYQYWVFFESIDEDLPSLEDMQEMPEEFDGSHVGALDGLISAYFLMHQAWRDEMAGCAVHDEPIDRLIEAFDTWNQPNWD